VPALIEYDESTAEMRVAGLTLLDRLVVSAHRAGCKPIVVVCRAGTPPLKRATSLGIQFRVDRERPGFEGPVLMANSSLLVSADDLRVLLRNGGRLDDLDGNPLPVGVVVGPLDSIESAVATLPRMAPVKVAKRVVDAASARSAERALWKSVASSADGMVDRAFNRPCGRPLSKLLVSTPIGPNAVSLASIAIGLAAAWLFAAGDYVACLVAAILFQISAIVDCVDGEIARVAFKESRLGKWLDLAGDQVVHVAVFGGIAIGLMKTGPGNTALWLGLSAVAGALLSFAVVVRGLSRPLDQNGRLQKLIDSATNRDFSVVVLVLAAMGKLEWFLWLAAIGSHVFWISALALQRVRLPTEERAT
jgi:phosphatidylglycerophosphate synthase